MARRCCPVLGLCRGPTGRTQGCEGRQKGRARQHWDPRRKRGKCQRQMAPICCAKLGIICLHPSTGLVQPSFQQHLGDHLRLSEFLQWLITEASQRAQGSLTRL